MIYDDIKKDMVQAMKNGDTDIKLLLRLLVSDIQRDPNKDYNDKKVTTLIKHTVKTLYDNHDKYGKMKDLRDAEYLERIYLPKQINDSEIIKYLDTLDFSKFKNKMQAIGMVTKYFPDGSVDGSIIKNIVLKY
jgi:uncharacterized protein YqeY